MFHFVFVCVCLCTCVRQIEKIGNKSISKIPFFVSISKTFVRKSGFFGWNGKLENREVNGRVKIWEAFEDVLSPKGKSEPKIEVFI